MSNFDVILWATIAFICVGVGLTAVILLCRYVFEPKGYCTIAINDTKELEKRVAVGQTLLSALKNEGIAIPSPCGGRATCKQCKLQVLQGGGEPFDTDAATFTKTQLKDGWRLSCQVRVLEDMKVHIDERYLSIKEYKATVVSNKNVSSFIKELIVELPLGQKIEYRAGSYMEIAIPPFESNTSSWREDIDALYWPEWDRYKMWDRAIVFHSKDGIVRAYSLGSYPDEGEKLIFNVRIATPPLMRGEVSRELPWGWGSSYLFSLKAGDTVYLTGPYGESFMKDSDQDVYFLIGGAGSSFGRSHILDLLRRKKSHRKISMWYGARSLKENIYEDLYEDLEKECSNFSYHLVLSEPTEDDILAGWPKEDPLKTAFLYKAFDKGALQKMKNPEQSLFYVCGPPMHNKSVMKLLDDFGVPRENIVLDDFGS